MTIDTFSERSLVAMHRTFEPKHEKMQARFYTSSCTPDNSDGEVMGYAGFQTNQVPSRNMPVPVLDHDTHGGPFPMFPKKDKRHAPNSNAMSVRRVFSDALKSSLLSNPPEVPARRALSESQDSSHPPAPPPKSQNVLSIFGRKKKDFKNLELEERPESHDLPPMPPTKENEFQIRRSPHSPLPPQPHEFMDTLKQDLFLPNVSESAVASHREFEPSIQERSTFPLVVSHALPVRGKWAPQTLDFKERIRRQKEAERRRKEEEEEAMREEFRRAEEARMRKEEQSKQENEEDERRRIELEDELRRASQDRKLKRQMEEYEENRKYLELEERKRIDRQRRIEEHKRLDEWRKEQERTANDEARRAEEERRKEELERQRKIQLAEDKARSRHRVGELSSGWVTMQTSDYIAWKRRFYRFEGTTMYLYRSPQDTTEYLDKVELQGKIKALREWDEGYEDLKAIPFSFALEFAENDVRSFWSVYTDSEEEKYKLLGLLHYAAGL